MLKAFAEADDPDEVAVGERDPCIQADLGIVDIADIHLIEIPLDERGFVVVSQMEALVLGKRNCVGMGLMD